MSQYDFKSIERKWQKFWEEERVFRAENHSEKPKFYCLVEFPYPSGDGLHVGHPRSYTALDILARKKRMEGYNVLFPMGFDSFGLPSENYAIKTGIHPTITTEKNVARFTQQLKSLGFSFDWDRSFSTTEPEYYKWTQWIFIQFYNHGLAYKKKMPINWCLACKIGLANEEVVDGCCERCGGEVEKRQISQWMLKITEYADKLLEDLDSVNYLEKIKLQQKNWIGKSEGATVHFKIDGHSEKDLSVFTTRPDTLFGVTFMVLAPEHDFIDSITTDEYKSHVDQYRKSAAKKSDLERTELSTVKTGAFTGAYAINPVNDQLIPIWIADYVLSTYGTGAIMAVPAHDERDFEFAKKFQLPIQCIIEPDESLLQKYKLNREEVLESKVCWPHDGKGINSSNNNGLDINGLSVETTISTTISWLDKNGMGEYSLQYKLRDWVFSRQRYWGEPIPMILCEDCGWNPVPEEDLPVLLPEVDKYEPTDTGESPLAVIHDWVNATCPKCAKPAKRETDTMPNWAGSSWYFLRYIDPHNNKNIANHDLLKYWMPVDWYNGGMEHTTLHLLYSRFWNKFLHDIGVVPVSEPYLKRTSHGMVLGEGGEKMSKSRGNVINPDDVVDKYGADVFRMYEMFIGPFDQSASWDTKGIVGIDRFIQRVWKFFDIVKIEDKPEFDKDLLYTIHTTIKKLTEDIDSLNLNTGISQLMICLNDMYSRDTISKDTAMSFLLLLSPYAPHITEEIWKIRISDDNETISYKSWPSFNPDYLVKDTITIAVQVNGKLRGEITVSADATKEDILNEAKKAERVNDYLQKGTLIKEIVVPGRLVNFVVK